MDALDRQIEYFKKHQKDLAKKHYGKIVLIYEEDVKGFFESSGEGYKKALINGYTEGEFLLRKCIRADEEKPTIFHSRIA